MPQDASGGRRKIGQILVAAKVLTDEQLEDALATQVSGGSRSRLGTTVVELGLADEEDIAAALATQLRLSRVDLSEVEPDGRATSRVPRKLAFQHIALPIELENGVLTVAVADPTNVVAKDDLRTAAGADRVHMLVATETEVRDALRHAYGTDQSALDALREDQELVETVPEHEDGLADVSPAARASDAPIVKLTNLILAEAIEARASDVHVEPGRTSLRVRYRVDGMLREVMHVPRDAAGALLSRLKIMARLDIGERRRPQDGRTVVRVDGTEVDLRVATMPTLFGESVTLRLLRKGVDRVGLDEVGMTPDDLDRYRWALERPQGLVIMTGPTGSGKTSTLYAGLHEIAHPVRNIVTLEDPIEYELHGVNQTQVHEKVGLTFARGLRSILRQDPDVVLVGEIRDEETAQLAMQASFTGHLVLSTLHTNDAPSSIVRLMDLGIEPFLIASSLLLVVSQRLTRVVCEHCKEPYEPPGRVLEMLELTRDDVRDASLMRGRGCEACGRTGFLGRSGLFEMLPISAPVRELILEGASETAISRVAHGEGMRTLRDDGVRKALAGITTLEEVLRVSPSKSWNIQRCPTCGHHLGEGFVACPSCGTDLDERACSTCGRHLNADWTLCPYCRSAVQTASGAPATPTTNGHKAADGTAQNGQSSAQDAHDEPSVNGDGEAGGVPDASSPAAASNLNGHGLSAHNGVRADGAGDAPRAGEEAGQGTHEDRSTSPPVVLVVDDESSVRQTVSLMLLDEYYVLEAGSGRIGIDMARHHDPDAIVLDVLLPDMDGLEVARQLRSDERTRSIPILMITGLEGADKEVEALLAGADDFLRKPLDDEVLRGRLGAVRRRAVARG